MTIDGISHRVVHFQGGQQTNSVDASPAARRGPKINEIETHRDNLMADNFFDPNKEKSTYHTVMLESFRTREVAKAKRAAVISILAAEIPAIDYVSKNSPGNTTALTSEEYYNQVNQAEITESSEDYLKSEREKLGEATQETPASGDAQGASAQAEAASDPDSISTSEAAAAPVDVTV